MSTVQLIVVIVAAWLSIGALVAFALGHIISRRERQKPPETRKVRKNPQDWPPNGHN